MTRPILAALALALAAAPATGSAASIEVTTSDAGTQVIAYEARTGEVSSLEMVGTVDGAFDLRYG